VTWIFLDASGIIALLNKSDNLHEQAQKTLNQFTASNYQFLTTDLILVETGNTLSTPKFKKAVKSYIKSLQNSNKVQIIYTAKDDFDIDLSEFEEFQDKDWGLVDCISFNIMRRHHCIQAFTHDHHFEQAGFKILI
jgi:predicted nucleic acid-binding protein